MTNDEIDALVAECGGDPREAIRALLHDLTMLALDRGVRVAGAKCGVVISLSNAVKQVEGENGDYGSFGASRSHWRLPEPGSWRRTYGIGRARCKSTLDTGIRAAPRTRLTAEEVSTFRAVMNLGDPDMARMNEIAATWEAISEASRLNKVAAQWTAASVGLSALATVLGALS